MSAGQMFKRIEISFIAVCVFLLVSYWRGGMERTMKPFNQINQFGLFNKKKYLAEMWLDIVHTCCSDGGQEHERTHTFTLFYPALVNHTFLLGVRVT